MGRGGGGESAISFRATTSRFHRSYTSRWIPIRRAGLYLALSPFQRHWLVPLDCRNKINARENDEGNRDERMCACFVAPCKSFTRESQAKFESSPVRNCGLVRVNHFPHDFLDDKRLCQSGASERIRRVSLRFSFNFVETLQRQRVKIFPQIIGRDIDREMNASAE